jgi:hypothetical protein
MKKRYDEGGYIPKSIFNQEGTDIADVGSSRVMTSPAEEEPKPKKKAKPARKENYSNEGRSSKPKEELKQFSSSKSEMKQISGPEAKPRSKLDPYGVIEGAANKVKGAASSIGDALSSPFRAIREAGSRGNPDAPKKMAGGGMTASRRADGCAVKGKTKGRFV